VYLHLLCFVLLVLCYIYCFFYVYIFLLVFSVLPPSDNSIAVSNNNNNNNTLYYFQKETTDRYFSPGKPQTTITTRILPPQIMPSVEIVFRVRLWSRANLITDLIQILFCMTMDGGYIYLWISMTANIVNNIGAGERTALFLVITQRRFGTTYWSYFQGKESKDVSWPIKVGCVWFIPSSHSFIFFW
jgi:hypothetical protein